MADVFIPAACQWRVLLQPKQIDWLVCTYCCLFLKQLSLLHSNAALWHWQLLSCLLAHHHWRDESSFGRSIVKVCLGLKAKAVFVFHYSFFPFSLAHHLWCLWSRFIKPTTTHIFPMTEHESRCISSAHGNCIYLHSIHWGLVY